MASTTTSLLPNQQQQQQQQQPQEEVPYTQVVPNNNNNNNAWHNNINNNNNNNNKGSIGPFFAVISVLAVLAIISCLVGRFWLGKEETPLESIKYRGSCFGWLRRRWWRRPFARGVDVGGVRGGKVAAVAPPLADENGN